MEIHICGATGLPPPCPPPTLLLWFSTGYKCKFQTLVCELERGPPAVHTICLLWSNFKTDMSSCLHHSSLQHTASVSSSMLLMEKCTPGLKQGICCSCPSQPLPPCHSVKGTVQPQHHKYIYFLLTVVLFIH